MITILSVWQDNYQALADLTIKNREEYARRHGHGILNIKIPNGNPYDVYGRMGFLNVKSALFALENIGTDWVYNMAVDGMVTNMTQSLEDSFGLTGAEKEKVIVSCDCNGPNSGNFIAGNSEWTKQFLRLALSFQKTADNEMVAFESAAKMENEWDKRFKILPQKPMNCYDYTQYVEAVHGKTSPTDILGNEGQWESGDFFVHFAGLWSCEQRVEMARKYERLVIR